MESLSVNAWGPVVLDQAPATMIIGESGCLHGATPIYDPVDNTISSVENRSKAGKEFHVYAMDGTGQVRVAKAAAPIQYHPCEMIEFTFEGGGTITVTPQHRFWNGGIYVAASSVCDSLQQFGVYHLPTNSVHDLLVRQQDALHLIDKVGDYLDDYQHDLHSCDEQPHGAQEPFQGCLLLQDDALVHSQQSYNKDGFFVKQECSHPYQLSFPPSKSRSLFRNWLYSELVFHVSEELGKHGLCLSQELQQWLQTHCPLDKEQPPFARVLGSIPNEGGSPLLCLEYYRWLLDRCRVALQSLCGIYLRCKVEGLLDELQHLGEQFDLIFCSQELHEEDPQYPIYLSQEFQQSHNAASHCCTVSKHVVQDSFDSPDNERLSDTNNQIITAKIISARAISAQPYYDFHVPIYENYWACGLFHHNSGKSVLAQALVSNLKGKVLIIDPVWQPGTWGGLPAVSVDANGDYGEIDKALEWVLGEMHTRGAQLQQGVSDFEPLTILWDEVPDTVAELPNAGLVIRRLGQRGRHTNMKLIGISQSDRVGSWGIEGYGDVAENFAHIVLGNKAIEVLPYLAGQDHVGVLEWRGKNYPIELQEMMDRSKQLIKPSRAVVLPGIHMVGRDAASELGEAISDMLLMKSDRPTQDPNAPADTREAQDEKPYIWELPAYKPGTPEKNCGNCEYYKDDGSKTGYCSEWDSTVNKDMVCAKWEAKDEKAKETEEALAPEAELAGCLAVLDLYESLVSESRVLMEVGPNSPKEHELHPSKHTARKVGEKWTTGGGRLAWKRAEHDIVYMNPNQVSKEELVKDFGMSPGEAEQYKQEPQKAGPNSETVPLDKQEFIRKPVYGSGPKEGLEITDPTELKELQKRKGSVKYDLFHNPDYKNPQDELHPGLAPARALVPTKPKEPRPEVIDAEYSVKDSPKQIEDKSWKPLMIGYDKRARTQQDTEREPVEAPYLYPVERGVHPSEHKMYVNKDGEVVYRHTDFQQPVFQKNQPGDPTPAQKHARDSMQNVLRDKMIGRGKELASDEEKAYVFHYAGERADAAIKEIDPEYKEQIKAVSKYAQDEAEKSLKEEAKAKTIDAAQNLDITGHAISFLGTSLNFTYAKAKQLNQNLQIERGLSPAEATKVSHGLAVMDYMLGGAVALATIPAVGIFPPLILGAPLALFIPWATMAYVAAAPITLAATQPGGLGAKIKAGLMSPLYVAKAALKTVWDTADSVGIKLVTDTHRNVEKAKLAHAVVFKGPSSPAAKAARAEVAKPTLTSSGLGLSTGGGSYSGFGGPSGRKGRPKGTTKHKSEEEQIAAQKRSAYAWRVRDIKKREEAGIPSKQWKRMSPKEKHEAWLRKQTSKLESVQETDQRVIRLAQLCEAVKKEDHYDGVFNKETREKLADAIEVHDHDDWYICLLISAYGGIGDVDKAIKVADASWDEVTEAPEGDEDTDALAEAIEGLFKDERVEGLMALLEGADFIPPYGQDRAYFNGALGIGNEAPHHPSEDEDEQNDIDDYYEMGSTEFDPSEFGSTPPHPDQKAVFGFNPREVGLFRSKELPQMNPHAKMRQGFHEEVDERVTKLQQLLDGDEA